MRIVLLTVETTMCPIVWRVRDVILRQDVPWRVLPVVISGGLEINVITN